MPAHLACRQNRLRQLLVPAAQEIPPLPPQDNHAGPIIRQEPLAAGPRGIQGFITQ